MFFDLISSQSHSKVSSGLSELDGDLKTTPATTQQHQHTKQTKT